jgi:uncharacterized repeat protein (TIGR03803 family)
MNKLNWVTKACGVLLLWATAAVALPAQTFTTIYNFCSQTNCTDGSSPWAGLIQATDGDLYGTTVLTGAYGLGTVFKVTVGGNLTTLFSFDGEDGSLPYGGLVQDSNGSFYGTTVVGPYSSGTVFKIAPSGNLTALFSFDVTDGTEPYAALVQDSNGAFYGTTAGGGTHRCGSRGGTCGTVFKITPTGTLTTLHNFVEAEGYEPFAGVVEGTDTNFYGTTSAGGANDNSLCEANGLTGCGTVFKITPSGMLTTLYSFCSQTECADGSGPRAALVQGTDGNFYGTTEAGGANTNSECTEGCGTVFKITPSGTLTTLYSFCSDTGCTDGYGPLAGLIEGTDGNFYGTTEMGGANTNSECTEGCGTIFKITPSGTLSTLHSFDGTDGYLPIAGLVQDTNGEFYGTTYSGGLASANCANSSCGTVFSLNVGLGQFVETLPTSGKVGATVKILGSFLTGATSVTFNGTAATFTVNSKSEITTTVPTGATTGTVQVISPRLGTLSSNLPFTVKP